MEMILWIIIGMFVGWNFPQPLYAKWIQAKVLNFFAKAKDLSDDNKKG